jgi:hypothetical protein
MPSVTASKHLRVEIPQTTDGMNLAYDGGGKVITKTIFLPLSARRRITASSLKKPAHLQYKITEVDGDVQQKAPAKQKVK